VDQGWLEESYGAFPEIEDAFHAALDESLSPRGPDALYDLVAGLGLPPGSRALDAGCGEGRHAVELARRFGFTVLGVDPVGRQVELASGGNPLPNRVTFARGSLDALPLEDASVDLVWCRDVIEHVGDLPSAFRELRRVLRPRGRALLYTMVATDLMEGSDRAVFFGAVPKSFDAGAIEDAIASAGFRVDLRDELGSEWGELAEEETGKPGRRLLWAARLRRDPERYRAQFGDTAYRIMLTDCLWHVYAMLGKLSRRAWVLS
jgi:SAM-dependent methyltransferase